MLVCSASHAGNDFRCLTTTDTDKPIRLNFSFPADDQNIGYVQYEKGSKPIAVKRGKEVTLENSAGDRPWLFQTDWKELSKPYGVYRVVSQGAIIESVEYTAPNKHKSVLFNEDISSENEDGCAWQSRERAALMHNKSFNSDVHAFSVAATELGRWT